MRASPADIDRAIAVLERQAEKCRETIRASGTDHGKATAAGIELTACENVAAALRDGGLQT